MGMISEIYASGHNGISAFLIVENGEVVHFGSHQWGDTISFDDCTMQTNDTDCEILAVICALMMCRNNNRQLVNIYTDSIACQARYMKMTTASMFIPSLKRCYDGIDIHAESFNDLPTGDEFKLRCLDMVNITDKN